MTKFLRTTFLQYTSRWLLPKFVEYLFLESFFCFFGQICFAPSQMFNVEIFWNFDTGVQKNIFCFLSHFTWKFFQKRWKEFNPFSPYLILYNRKHFCSISTNLSNLLHSKWPFLFYQKFPLLSSDLKNMLTEYFLNMQPFVNIL